ncbi:MAG: beta-propeller domain-containing protein [Patescibacteria group bacterium]|jgi:uncharacterized secreted protein with C-terminal beta-propeller domain
MSKKFFKLSLILTITAVFVSGCTFPWQKKPLSPIINQAPIGANAATSTTGTVYTNQLKKFNNYQELSQFLSDNNSDNGNSYRLIAGSADITDSVPNNYLGQAPIADTLTGYDQADIIKSDGKYIYALARNELSIIKITTASEAEVVSKITFKSRPQAMLLSGNFLAVYGTDTAQSFSQTSKNQSPYTFLKVFDISDQASPKQMRDLSFEGSYVDARLINNYVYFLINTSSNYLTGDQIIPRVLDNGQVLATSCGGEAKCLAPEIYYFDIPYNAYSLTSVIAINLKDNAAALSGQIYIVDNEHSFYLTPNNLNIIYTPVINIDAFKRAAKRELVYPKLVAADQEQINKIETASDFILNNNEKEIKVSGIIDRFLFSLKTDDQSAWRAAISSSTDQKLNLASSVIDRTYIYKMAIKDNQLTYRAFGQVNGTILNDSSLDENGDYLRLVTTNKQQPPDLNATSTDYYNNIYVLGPDLQIVGSLENLTTASEIYNTRFLGNRLYLTTLKSDDPLFAISLNDPTKPTVLGALKVPGISNYLQPLDSNGNKFAVFSRSGEINYSDGTKTTGFTGSLFDFTDLSKPQELASYLIGDSSTDSIASSDHQALFYSPDKSLLSLPVALQNSKGKVDFSGALVFGFNNNEFNLRGRIDHSAGGYFDQTDNWSGFNYYDNTVKRSLVVGDNLVTFSNKFLDINNLSDLKSVASIKLTTAGDNDVVASAVETATTTDNIVSEAMATTTDDVATTTDNATAASSTRP